MVLVERLYKNILLYVGMMPTSERARVRTGVCMYFLTCGNDVVLD